MAKTEKDKTEDGRNRPAILEAIQQASAADLDNIDVRIEELTKELESLREVRRVIEVRLNGKPKAKRGEKKGLAAPVADRLYEYILAHGPQTPYDLAEKLGLSIQGIGVAAARSGWFTRVDGRIAVKLNNGEAAAGKH